MDFGETAATLFTLAAVFYWNAEPDQGENGAAQRERGIDHDEANGGRGGCR